MRDTYHSWSGMSSILYWSHWQDGKLQLWGRVPSEQPILHVSCNETEDPTLQIGCQPCFFSRICVRRQRGKCRLQVTPTEQEKSFKVEGVTIQTRANSGNYNCHNDFVQFPLACNAASPKVSMIFIHLSFVGSTYNKIKVAVFLLIHELFSLISVPGTIYGYSSRRSLGWCSCLSSQCRQALWQQLQLHCHEHGSSNTTDRGRFSLQPLR